MLVSRVLNVGSHVGKRRLHRPSSDSSRSTLKVLPQVKNTQPTRLANPQNHPKQSCGVRQLWSAVGWVDLPDWSNYAGRDGFGPTRGVKPLLTANSAANTRSTARLPTQSSFHHPLASFLPTERFSIGRLPTRSPSPTSLARPPTHPPEPNALPFSLPWATQGGSGGPGRPKARREPFCSG